MLQTGWFRFVVVTFWTALVFLDLPGWLPIAGAQLRAPAQQSSVTVDEKTRSTFRIPGEFEPQRALVLSVCDWQPHHSHILKQLVEETHGHVDLLILHNDSRQLAMALDWLKDIADLCSHVHFCQIQLDSIWIRDFAPIFAETDKGTRLIDFYYEGSRPHDERMPKSWSEQTEATVISIPFILQGGNFLSNGQGTTICTNQIFQDSSIRISNPPFGVDPLAEGRKILTDALIKDCHLKQLVILEPLQAEATRHADMFATFVAADQIVVASVDPRRDPVNAAILDRNAAILERVRIGESPLQVHRLPIPVRDGNSWSAFTNSIITNGLLLMPVYESDPAEMVQAAVEIYQKLLPNHQIKTVDITTFRQLQGELHCLSMNLPAWAELPSQTITWQQATGGK